MIAILGGTGILGHALAQAGRQREFRVIATARHGADHSLDVCDEGAVRAFFATHRPQAVVNCAALTDLNQCEQNPGLAYLVNARAVLSLTRICADTGARFVHVSTDHFFTGDAGSLHDEMSSVTLLNEYAVSKFTGEAFALGNRDNLVVRTNLTGWRGWSDRPTFIEWAVRSLREDGTVQGFSDFYTSTIDAECLANAILDLLDRKATGLLNVAASEVSDKATFLRRLARELKVPADKVVSASVRSLPTARAESLGLDVRKAEGILGYRLPTTDEVIASLVRSEPRITRAIL